MNKLYTDRKKWREYRITTENIIIVLLAAFSIFMFLLTFFPLSKISKEMQVSFEMGHPIHNWIIVLDLILFVIFFALRKDFCCPAGRGNRRQTWTFILLAIAGVFSCRYSLCPASVDSKTGPWRTGNPGSGFADRRNT